MSATDEPLSTVKRAIPGWLQFFHGTPKAQELQGQLALDMYGSAIGPMPIDLFMNEFMPKNSSFDMAVPKDFFSKTGILKGPNELAMYSPLVRSSTHHSSRSCALSQLNTSRSTC